MWETIQKLRYRAKAGISVAQDELNLRLSDRMVLPLKGIHGEKLCLTAAEKLLERAKELDAEYSKLPVHRGVKDIILLDAYSSATIEGARTTVAQVKARLSDPQTKDDRMVVNTIKAANYAFEHPVTEENIRRLWDKIVDGVCENEDHKGTRYRDGMVFIGNAERNVHTPAQVEQIPALMADWFTFRKLDTLHPLLNSFVSHFYFVYVHPFCDGNGRLARIVNITQLYHDGYRRIKGMSLSSAINRQLNGYYAGLEEAEQRQISDGEEWLDLSPFVTYMLDVFEKSVIDAALSVNKLTEQEAKVLERMNHAGLKAEITVQKAAKILEVSESRTRTVLRSLVSKGYLDVDDSHSPYIYRLLQRFAV